MILVKEFNKKTIQNSKFFLKIKNNNNWNKEFEYNHVNPLRIVLMKIKLYLNDMHSNNAISIS